MEQFLPLRFEPNIVDLLAVWYRKNARALPWRERPEPYRVWLSEIMLQQTRIETVIPYYERFLAEFPTIRALAAAEEERLLKRWEGLGYYSRARNLQKAARVIETEHAGVFPQTHEAIRALPGIGDYTAGAIASICFDLPTPAVDGNVLRVSARLLEIRTPVEETPVRRAVTKALAEIYPPTGTDRCGVFTQSLMELGETLCIPQGTPLCGTCPLAGCCAGRRNGTAAALPLRLPQKVKRKEVLTVFLLSADGCFAVRRRPPKGLLGGMWEFPNIPGALSETEAATAVRAWGLSPAAIQAGTPRTHLFTHIRWEMTSYFISCHKGVSEFVWVSPEELANSYTLPTAFRIFLPTP